MRLTVLCAELDRTQVLSRKRTTIGMWLELHRRVWEQDEPWLSDRAVYRSGA